MERRRPRKQRKSGEVSGRGRGRLWSVGPRRQREGGATQSGQVGRGVSGGAHELQAELRDAGERCGLSALRDAGRSGAGRGARVWRKWAERVEPAGPDWAEGFAGFLAWAGFGLS